MLNLIYKSFQAAWHSVNGTNTDAEECATDFLSAVITFSAATYLAFCQCTSFWYSIFLYLLSIYFIQAWRTRLPKALWRHQVQKTLYGEPPSYNRKVLSYSFLYAAIFGSIVVAPISYFADLPPKQNELQALAVRITTAPYLHTPARGNSWISFTAKTEEKMFIVEVSNYADPHQSAVLRVARGDQVIIFVNKDEVEHHKVTAWIIKGKNGDILSYSASVNAHRQSQIRILAFIALMFLAGMIFYPHKAYSA